MMRRRYLFPYCYVALLAPLFLPGGAALQLGAILVYALVALRINRRLFVASLFVFLSSLGTFIPFSLIVQAAACSSPGIPREFFLTCVVYNSALNVLKVVLMTAVFFLAIANESRKTLADAINTMWLPRTFRMIAITGGAMIEEFRRTTGRVHLAFAARGSISPSFNVRNIASFPYMLGCIWASMLKMSADRLHEQWSQEAFWLQFVPVGLNTKKERSHHVYLDCFSKKIVTTFLLGKNFSGRSEWLAQRRKKNPWPKSGSIGPIPESSLTGLAGTVAGELALFGYNDVQSTYSAVRELGLMELVDHHVGTLSGGESVRAGLASLSLQRVHELHIDTALEQLDYTWREKVLAMIRAGQLATETFVADNHLVGSDTHGFSSIVDFLQSEDESTLLPMTMDTQKARAYIRTVSPLDISFKQVSFSYQSTREVFSGVSLTLRRGEVYFLTGPNGSGKTTFVKLLSGAVLQQKGAIFFEGKRFNPRRPTRHTALAFQNPDYQWTSQSVAAELAKIGITDAAADVLVAFGLHSRVLNTHPVELPFVLKKRLAIALAACAPEPWIVLDEPTLGQDWEYCVQLASLLLKMLKSGRGIILISHHERFKSLFPSAITLAIAGRTITKPSAPYHAQNP
jgi:energy-coupling factor transport system ATP-binding protein